MDDCQEVNVDDGEKIVAPDDISDKRDTYQKKYCSLKRLCDQVQHTNERLVNRIHHVKRLIRHHKMQRRWNCGSDSQLKLNEMKQLFLMNQLKQCGESLDDVSVPAMWEEGPSASQGISPSKDVPLKSTPSTTEAEPDNQHLPTDSRVQNTDAPRPNASEEKLPQTTVSLQPVPASPVASPVTSVTKPQQVTPPTTPSSKTTGSAGKSKRARPTSDGSRHAKSSNDSGEKRITSSSGFLLFYQHRKQDVQDVITKEQGKVPTQQELAAILSQQWAALPADKQQVYQDLASSIRSPSSLVDPVKALPVLQSPSTLS